MRKLDEEILRAFFQYEEYQMHRLRFERLLHPELLELKKLDKLPPISETKKIKVEELGKIGFGEEFYQKMLAGEEKKQTDLEELTASHPLWLSLPRIKSFGLLTCGKFIAAGGDIDRCPTSSGFWYGMGLDIVDGKAPRRIRGKRDVIRKIPAFPHVTRVGEQIRQQMLMQNPFFHELYLMHKADYLARYPDKPLMFAHKHGQRISQKVFYSCLWKCWREAYGLPAPYPYVFDILKHSDGHLIDISDFSESEK